MRDREILNEKFDQVDVMILNTKGGAPLLWGLVKQFFFLIFNISKYDLIFCWFAGYHSLFPILFARVFKKKNAIILGGTDCHNYPEIGHGNYRKWLYGGFTKKSIESSANLFPVHKTLIHSRPTYNDSIFKDQGFAAFCKKVGGNIVPIDCGFELPSVEVLNIERMPKSFLSVSGQLSGPVSVRKGIDMVVELAKRLPDCNFTLVGSNYSGPLLDNLKVLDRIPYEDLVTQYLTHEYYLQLSIAEGFPNALAEAMLYGCIPIGSSVFGIPDIIGNNGYILEKKDIDLALQMTKKIVMISEKEKNEMKTAASNSIRNRFGLNHRANEIIKALSL